MEDAGFTHDFWRTTRDGYVNNNPCHLKTAGWILENGLQTLHELGPQELLTTFQCSALFNLKVWLWCRTRLDMNQHFIASQSVYQKHGKTPRNVECLKPFFPTFSVVTPWFLVEPFAMETQPEEVVTLYAFAILATRTIGDTPDIPGGRGCTKFFITLFDPICWGKWYKIIIKSYKINKNGGSGI